ncbi:methionyl-tRNA formyltransferase [Psychromonas sp. SA13A]|uniref:methionyl-tRNA formyltransferase n=1 Tax=Psychromonas sp. SA13A TaxID=2686346 RepID=UPI001407F8BB|nr:methionyl-tRNA formyltransferase [Psychromonas sp. SA13A]
MSAFLVLSEQSRHKILFEKLSNTLMGDWYFIDNKSNFNLQIISQINPLYIFIPHWSYKIPLEITERFACVIFHMTDLPYGRGGSPLQNLIVRGFKETKLTAFRCIDELDAGPVYCKATLILSGTAEEIFKEADQLVMKLIFDIIQNDLTPKEQQGEVVSFQRRTPQQGDIILLTTLNNIYDYIRMLDADGYPNAFIDSKYFKLNFSNASFENNELTAKVVFKELNNDS